MSFLYLLYIVALYALPSNYPYIYLGLNQQIYRLSSIVFIFSVVFILFPLGQDTIYIQLIGSGNWVDSGLVQVTIYTLIQSNALIPTRPRCKRFHNKSLFLPALRLWCSLSKAMPLLLREKGEGQQVNLTKVVVKKNNNLNYKIDVNINANLPKSPVDLALNILETLASKIVGDIGSSVAAGGTATTMVKATQGMPPAQRLFLVGDAAAVTKCYSI